MKNSCLLLLSLLATTSHVWAMEEGASCSTSSNPTVGIVHPISTELAISREDRDPPATARFGPRHRQSYIYMGQLYEPYCGFSQIYAERGIQYPKVPLFDSFFSVGAERLDTGIMSTPLTMLFPSHVASKLPDIIFKEIEKTKIDINDSLRVALVAQNLPWKSGAPFYFWPQYATDGPWAPACGSYWAMRNVKAGLFYSDSQRMHFNWKKPNEFVEDEISIHPNSSLKPNDGVEDQLILSSKLSVTSGLDPDLGQSLWSAVFYNDGCKDRALVTLHWLLDDLQLKELSETLKNVPTRNYNEVRGLFEHIRQLPSFKRNGGHVHKLDPIWEIFQGASSLKQGSEPNNNAREHTSSLISANLSEDELWVMGQPQRQEIVFKKMLENSEQRSAHGLPDNPIAQKRLINLALELIAAKVVSMPKLPEGKSSSFRIYFSQAANVLNKANDIMKLEKDFGFSKEECFKCMEFAAKLKQIKAFPLTNQQSIRLFREIKSQTFDEDNPSKQEGLTTVLWGILESSLPMDHPTWPNLEAKNDATFIPFIQTISLMTSGLGHTKYLEEADKKRLASQQGDINKYYDMALLQKKDQFDKHGQKFPLPESPTMKFRGMNTSTTLTVVTEFIEDILSDLYEETKKHPLSLNYTFYCCDPFLSILKKTDDELYTILAEMETVQGGVEYLKEKVNAHAIDKLFDAEFNVSFSKEGFGLNQETPLCRKAVARLLRIYKRVKEHKSAQEAAQVIYAFGAENSERCIDGKTDRIVDLEREYVYGPAGVKVDQPEIVIGLNLAKLFLDHRMKTLRFAIDALFANGEPRTYAWRRMHRAMALGFGLVGGYDDMLFGNNHTEAILIEDFIKKYFKGGTVKAKDDFLSNLSYQIEAFTPEKMTKLVKDEIGKAMGGLFDDKTLDYMIHSDLVLRQAYKEFQEHEGDASYENVYFKDASKSLRIAITDETIQRVLYRYNYIYVRD